ncbi:hypothetical protein [Paenibacillus sp. RC67]|uniref:hypothetical protein n=1 Tax=Paenibacillus sp. RC67 TaxID=3039392 RepID=UPI0024AE1AC0|nr:hypothetical protein [Paenibacillus sp. RC67]
MSSAKFLQNHEVTRELFMWACGTGRPALINKGISKQKMCIQSIKRSEIPQKVKLSSEDAGCYVGIKPNRNKPITERKGR